MPYLAAPLCVGFSSVTMTRKLFVGGNWKLNPASQAQAKALVEALNGGSWSQDAVGECDDTLGTPDFFIWRSIMALKDLLQ